MDEEEGLAGHGAAPPVPDLAGPSLGHPDARARCLRTPAPVGDAVDTADGVGPEAGDGAGGVAIGGKGGAGVIVGGGGGGEEEQEGEKEKEGEVRGGHGGGRAAEAGAPRLAVGRDREAADPQAEP